MTDPAPITASAAASAQTDAAAAPQSERARRRLQPFGALVALAMTLVMPVLAPSMYVFASFAIWGQAPTFLLMPVLFLAGLVGVVAGMFVRSTKQAAVLSALSGALLVGLYLTVTGGSFS